MCGTETFRRGEGASGRWSAVATSRAVSGDESGIGGGASNGVFLVWSSRAWGEPMLSGGHFVSVSTAGLVGCCPGWPILGPWRGFSRETRDGGSAPWTFNNSRTTDPGGGGGERAALAIRNRPVWVSPVGHAHGSGWSPSMQAFPPLGSHPPVFSPGEHKRDNRMTHVLAQSIAGQTVRVVRDSPIGMGGSLPSLFTPVSGARRSGRGMRPAGWNSRSLKELSCDYVVIENSMVSGEKTSEVGKLHSFSDGLVGKRNVGDVPLQDAVVNSHRVCALVGCC